MGVHGYGCVLPDQIDWFREENKKILASDPSKGKGFLFMHIPTFEYVNLYNDYQYYASRLEDICCSSVNTGLFCAMKEQPTVEWVSVGHDHLNSYWGNYYGINLAYGRKTGYGSGSLLKHGARVFEVTESPYSIRTWVRTSDGSIDEDTTPSKRSLFSSKQTLCCGMSATELKSIPNSKK